jgi:hypothetical protein
MEGAPAAIELHGLGGVAGNRELLFWLFSPIRGCLEGLM